MTTIRVNFMVIEINVSLKIHALPPICKLYISFPPKEEYKAENDTICQHVPQLGL